MNFLAHVHLSADDEQLMIGNFIGDFVKGGSLEGRYTPQIIKGIELHRAIDHFTDNHDVVQASKNRLRPKYRHYSGVIVDMYYDHFLSKNWEAYHHLPLSAFVNQFYSLLQSNEHLLPAGVLRMMPYMIRGNWLVNYSKTEGIDRALTGMSRRTTFDSKMDEATQDLVKNYESFEEEFKLFFPSLKQFSEKWIASN